MSVHIKGRALVIFTRNRRVVRAYIFYIIFNAPAERDENNFLLFFSFSGEQKMLMLFISGETLGAGEACSGA